MSVDQFDPDVPLVIQGSVTSVLVIDPVGPPDVGNLVVDPTKDFQIKVTWEVKGKYAALWLAAGGKWNVSAYAESIGEGFEGLIAEDNTVPAGSTAPVTYQVTLNVPAIAAKLKEHTPGTDIGGLYKLAVAVFLDSTVAGPNDVFGFQEGPMIMVENPE